ncbi:MAG: alpha/beta hydrolase [Anaerolineae bacterium]|nr:alpha/beta hydrolase [Anaerolineae bacterium]
MKHLFVTRKHIIRIFMAVIVLLLVAIYFVFPTMMAVGVTLPTGEHTGEPPTGFTGVILTARDDVRLAAWYAAPQNGTAIILLHGSGNQREDVRQHSVMLRNHGFGVLALDLRGHGASEGQINRLGWKGTVDVGAAVEFLSAQATVERIGGMGLSMGGEVLLGAASDYPEIEAIVSEGATYRSVDEYTSLPTNRPFHRSMVSHIFSFMAAVFTQDAPPHPTIVDSLQASSTRFLFIAAGTIEDEIAYNELFQSIVDSRGELWIIPNAGHTGGFGSQPSAYEQRVVDFFMSAYASQQEG